MNPTFDRQYDKLLNSEPLYITRLPSDIDTLNSLVYRNVPHGSNYLFNKSFKMLSNDNPGENTPLWTVMGDCVCYWNNDVTNVTNVYQLVHNFTNSNIWNVSNTAHACTSRWKYKNRVMIQQEFACGHFVIYALDNPQLNDSGYTIKSWNLNIHNHWGYYISTQPDSYTMDNGGRYFGHWVYSKASGGAPTTENMDNASWLIDMGDEDTFIQYTSNDEPTDWPVGYYTESDGVYTRVLSNATFDPNETYYTTYGPRAFKFPNAMFMVPVLNTSYVITRMGTNTDSGKYITIIDASVYRTTRETLEAERELLPVDDPARKTDDEIHEEAFVASIVNRYENTNYTFEIPLTTTSTRPITGAFGFNNCVYIRFYDGVVVHLWYYNIQSEELLNLLETPQEFRDRAYFRGVYNGNYTNTYEYDLGDDRHWYARYHTCTTDGSTGNGIFMLSFNNQDTGIGDNDTNTYWRAFWTIEENNPTTIHMLSHKMWSDTTHSVANIDFDIKLVNDKELILYTMLGTCHCTYLGNQYSSTITAWDLGYWRNHKNDSSFDDRNPFARTDQPYISYYYYNMTRYIDANTVLKDKMIMLNARDGRIEVIPIHNYLTHEVTGTTTTIQCYNNPKEIQLKCPFSMVWSNTGLKYKTSWMGVPDFTTIQLRYNIGRYTIDNVRQFVIWHVITEAQFETITGEPYHA